jgi:hypothetical protein
MDPNDSALHSWAMQIFTDADLNEDPLLFGTGKGFNFKILLSWLFQNGWISGGVV